MKRLQPSSKGIVGIYKPKGPTSHDMIYKIRRLTGVAKVGHAGTLDPLAEGVLVVGIGREATRKLGVEVKKEKEYVAEVMLGVTSTTDDAEGEKTESQIGAHQKPNEDEVESAVNKFLGIIEQVPPVYSAVKVGGKEAYKLARKGKKVQLEPRKREVKEIKMLDYQWPILKLRVVTGSGVYIRSLARDVGSELDVGAYLKSLVRTRVGEFGIKQCFEID